VLENVEVRIITITAVQKATTATINMMILMMMTCRAPKIECRHFEYLPHRGD
jgi:hypothetical protein